MKSLIENADRTPGRFRFGENWAEFARGLDDRGILGAHEGLVRLAGPDALRGKSFLDIGCGSGLHALAALKLGASRMLAVDFDPLSVATTEKLLRQHAPDLDWRAERTSVFDLDPERHGQFDIVYSWGVLHHTGAMIPAIEKAAAMVAPKGQIILALYRKTPLCGFWLWEKKLYAKAPAGVQRFLQSVYIALFRLNFLLRGNDFDTYVRDYRSQRGMDYLHDVHDWMGGYPYESINPGDATSLLNKLGFKIERTFVHAGGLGLFGTGCDEFVFRRR